MKFQTPNGPYTRISFYVSENRKTDCRCQRNRNSISNESPEEFLHAHFRDNNIAPPSHVFTTTFIFNARPIISGIDRPQNEIVAAVNCSQFRVPLNSFASGSRSSRFCRLKHGHQPGQRCRGDGMQPCVAGYVQIKTKYSSTEMTGFSSIRKNRQQSIFPRLSVEYDCRQFVIFIWHDSLFSIDNINIRINRLLHVSERPPIDIYIVDR